MTLAALLIGLPAAVATAQTAVPPASGPNSAQPVPRATFIQTMDAEFRLIDADKNNILTRKEIEDAQRASLARAAQRQNAALFQLLDKDKNGTLTAGEFAALPMNRAQPNAAPLLAQTDGNRDGSVTLVEYRAGKLVNFDRMDTDKDGVVSASEMKAAGLIK
jgi:Ca2+-binding EF-hand superfamily protein